MTGERPQQKEEMGMAVCEPIPWAKPNFWGREQQYALEALASTWISGGPFVECLENEVAKFCGTRHAVAAANGTAALHMALMALGVGPGDEVIVPGFAFMAAANVALQLGAKPVFTEVDPATWCMTANEIEKQLSPRTKVIVPVHTYGNVCDLDEIMMLANSKAIAVVEDAAEAFASSYKNRMAGTHGVLGTFSFQATKTITTGEGGMVVTQNVELCEKMRVFRSHGMSRLRYWHEIPGHNFRLTNIQAALGCAQLEKIDDIIGERKRVYASYQRHLSAVSGVTMQHYSQDVQPVVWAVAIKLDPQVYPQGRDRVMRQLEESLIETRNGFYAASMLRHIYECPKLSVCEDLSRQVLILPTYPTLEDRQIQLICSRLRDLCQ